MTSSARRINLLQRGKTQRLLLSSWMWACLAILLATNSVTVEGWIPRTCASCRRHGSVARYSPGGRAAKETCISQRCRRQDQYQRFALEPLYTSKGNFDPKGYNDDFFGLIFLGSSGAINDVVFGGVFLAVSFVAATASFRSDRLDSVKLPGLVALVAFVLSLPVKALLPTSNFGVPMPVDETSATLAELVVCAASFLYTCVRSEQSN